ncbi:MULTISPECIES: DUF742 domain-containing protein [Streptomyces]|uniref:DUF742 domain-containing protein n=1 Tax=Streptomyces aidingensis TaxID=910347 RepID=A0A1I1U6R4_9ACTN|nr:MULTISPECIES: DUF742 domain-containing protein [Streptomyces]SFD65258.1 Protein of unknown function [Streptomyces aidingensis]
MTAPRRRAAGMVRSYTATGGRVVPTRRSLDGATLLKADATVALAGLPAQARRVMELCRPGVLSVAEVAFHLRMPGAVTRVIVSSLVDSGHLTAVAPFVPAAQQHDRDFLKRVLRGLQRM